MLQEKIQQFQIDGFMGERLGTDSKMEDFYNKKV
jgi:hypothetical protein